MIFKTFLLSIILIKTFYAQIEFLDLGIYHLFDMSLKRNILILNETRRSREEVYSKFGVHHQKR
jgi:hypothetical protein